MSNFFKVSVLTKDILIVIEACSCPRGSMSELNYETSGSKKSSPSEAENPPASETLVFHPLLSNLSLEFKCLMKLSNAKCSDPEFCIRSPSGGASESAV